MNCKHHEHEQLAENGMAFCYVCGKRLKSLSLADVAAFSALRVSYSRADLADKLKDWMIELWGDSPKNLDPEQRDQWHRDNGLIYHFICDHFPADATGHASAACASEPNQTACSPSHEPTC